MATARGTLDVAWYCHVTTGCPTGPPGALPTWLASPRNPSQSPPGSATGAGLGATIAVAVGAGDSVGGAALAPEPGDADEPHPVAMMRAVARIERRRRARIAGLRVLGRRHGRVH